CPPAGLGGGHHPPRNDPHRARAAEGQARRKDAAASARRADLRGAGKGGRTHAPDHQERDAECAGSRSLIACAPPGRRTRRRQLGRGALSPPSSYLRFFLLGLALPRRAAGLAFAVLAPPLAGNTATASISKSAPGRANCEMATVVLAGGAPMLKC